jgi:hypothetical protein
MPLSLAVFNTDFHQTPLQAMRIASHSPFLDCNFHRLRQRIPQLKLEF